MKLFNLLIPGDLHIVSRGFRKSDSSAAIFLDLDGTLWPDLGPGTIFANQHIDNDLLIEIDKLSKSGYAIIGFTNQTYFGYQSRLSLMQSLRYRYHIKLLVKKGVLDAIFICHHHPDSKIDTLRGECDKRKPASGLLLWARDKLSISLESSYAVGDRITDLVAAFQCGINKTFLLVGPDCMKWNKSGVSIKKRIITFQVSKDLKETLGKISGEISAGR